MRMLVCLDLVLYAVPSRNAARIEVLHRSLDQARAAAALLAARTHLSFVFIVVLGRRYAP